MDKAVRESQNTLWRRTARQAPVARALDQDLVVDIAVIGGGFLGLTAALHLAQCGARVAVLEAETIGAGASGVNAGFVAPHFSKADPAAVRASLGEERGRRLLECVASGGDKVFETARSLAIDCDAAQTGWLQPAHSDNAAEMLRARAELWRGLGRPVRFLSAGEIADQTSMTRYRGALLDASGGTIHPLSYAFGLARAASDKSAMIFEGARVDAIERVPNRWRLQSGARSVIADKILLCTNATTAGVARKLAATIVPLQVYQIATAPLAPEIVRRIAPARRPVSDTRGNIFTYRLDRDDRLISGGMAMIPIMAHRRMARMIVERLAVELKLPSIPDVDFVWRGTAAMTPDFLPHIYEFGPGFFGGVGCNGRGVAMTAVLGEQLAHAALGARLDDLAFPVASTKAIPFRAFAGAAPSFALAYARWRDWRAGQS